MNKERKTYGIVFTTSTGGNGNCSDGGYSSEESGEKEISRTELKLVPLPSQNPGQELWQPTINIHNDNGFKFTLDLPPGSYADLRAKLEKFKVRNGLDLAVKGLAYLSSLLETNFKSRGEKQ